MSYQTFYIITVADRKSKTGVVFLDADTDFDAVFDRAYDCIVARGGSSCLALTHLRDFRNIAHFSMGGETFSDGRYAVTSKKLYVAMKQGAITGICVGQIERINVSGDDDDHTNNKE